MIKEYFVNYFAKIKDTKKVHESLKETEKINDSSICGINWNILWLDDSNMKSKQCELCHLHCFDVKIRKFHYKGIVIDDLVENNF
jgi:hypothetical protein